MTAPPRVTIDGPEVHLSPKSAVVLGMAFHELTTNAVKYGGLSSDSGRVQVVWKLDAQGNDVVLTVDWCELNGPQVEGPPRPGFGSRLLRQTITRELTGQLDLRFEREGVCCIITVPIEAANLKAA
jgi:two-component sensor histidine kinase